MRLQTILIERLKALMDNKSGSLTRIRVEEKTSKAKGTKYYVLITSWNMPNDGPEYNCELFITAEQFTLISMSSPLSRDILSQDA